MTEAAKTVSVSFSPSMTPAKYDLPLHIHRLWLRFDLPHIINLRNAA